MTGVATAGAVPRTISSKVGLCTPVNDVTMVEYRRES